MDGIKTPSDNPAEEEIPHLPLKTYQWEDIKRARQKGGYPWTHLTKPPIEEEEVDTIMIRMEASRKSRSRSATEQSDAYDFDIETKLDTKKEQIPEIVKVLEENDGKIGSKKQSICMDEAQTNTNNKENLLSVTNTQCIRASSEEPSRSRKLSIESSHSRISLSKLAIKDKIKNAKEKLKIPRLLKRSKSDAQEIGKPKIKRTENKRLQYQGASEPVYIHIPLKLPPGETDEYSKYEFESPGPSSHSTSLTNLKHFGSGKRKMSLLGLLTELKRIYDEQVLASESTQALSSNKPAASKNANTNSTNNLPETEEIHSKISNHKQETKQKKSAKELKDMLASSDAYSVGSNISEYLDQEDEYEVITTEVPDLDIDCVIITDYDKPSGDAIVHSNEFPEWTRLDSGETIRPPIRAKSEEPKRKRKSSIDSSYSRKSLSKLAFMEKLKHAKDSLKMPRFLSFTKTDRKNVADTKIKEKKSSVGDIRTQKKNEIPLYIHIPLKLPTGQTDEFSHFEVPAKDKSNDGAVVVDNQECETPISPDVPNNDVHLIFLTPPSDDEILDANIPETPSETDRKFFETVKVEDLKSIAKKAVDTIYPDRKQLEVVTEDDKDEEETDGTTTYWQMHPVLVDVEDGLQLSDAAIAMINEEMAKELDSVREEDLKTQKTSQVKKKVSFKKSRAQDGERIYEDVGLPVDAGNDGKLASLQLSQSMSADEEKSYLDETVIKTTSLDEDYSKWSKITDHEYEPVNLPLEYMETFKATHIITDASTNSTLTNQNTNQAHDSISEPLHDQLAAQSFQDEIEECFFKPSKVPLPDVDETTKDLSVTDQTQLKKSTNKQKNKPSQTRINRSNFNYAIKLQAEKIKTKLQGIKKPHINLPQAPKFPSETFSKFKFKKPNFSVPKMPDMPSIKLASLSPARKDSSKNSWRKRQYSTESNASDSKIKRFDFRTYPRIFDKSRIFKQKSFGDSFDNTEPAPVFATVPRVNRKNTLKEPTVNNEVVDEPKEFYYDETRGFVTIPIDFDQENALQISPHLQYDNDHHEPPVIKMSHITPTTEWGKNDAIKNDINGEAAELQSNQSSVSLNEHRQGVIEEIDSDQFFLREKGISQDDIDVGNYLSSEIKEAFRNPINALTQFQSEDREYDIDATDQSQSSEERPKRKWIKKPKRKKTPHVSNEQLSFEFGSDPEDYMVNQKLEIDVPIPTRPKRRSKKTKKKKLDFEEVVPYQETIPLEEPAHERLDFIDDMESHSLEAMEYPESSDTYKNASDTKEDILGTSDPVNLIQDEEPEISQIYLNTLPHVQRPPIPPERKAKNAKSFNTMEVSLDDDRNFSVERSINSFEETEEPLRVLGTPPARPNRKRSYTRSESVTSLRDREYSVSALPPTRPIRCRSSTRSKSTPSIKDNENRTSSLPPIKPTRLRSRTRSESSESFCGSVILDPMPDTTIEIFCIEEPCVQIVCDHMGYAVVDKTKIRDPPLPPSRFPETPPRTRRKKLPVHDKFATVPRPPDRPNRNYSTLKKHLPTFTSSGNIFDKDKENIDINPYIEIDDEELARRLQSGEVIQKMRERPLPAPPRPPRKARNLNEVLRDISHELNIYHSTSTNDIDTTQTSGEMLSELDKQILNDDHEESITHGVLIIQHFEDPEALSRSKFFNSSENVSAFPILEREILIEQECTLKKPDELNEHLVVEVDAEEQEATRCSSVSKEIQEDDDYDEEISEVPEEFHKLNKPDLHTNTSNKPSHFDTEQVTITELTANKTDFDSVNMNISQIDSKARNLIISGIDFPSDTIEDMINQFKATLQQQNGVADESKKDDDIEIDQLHEHETCLYFSSNEPPPIPPRHDSVDNLADVSLSDIVCPEHRDSISGTDEEDNLTVGKSSTNDPPIRPPRRFSHLEKQPKNIENQISMSNSEDSVIPDSSIEEMCSTKESDVQNTTIYTPSIVDIQMSQLYVASEPPASFYNLPSTSLEDSQKNDIPTTSCHKCHSKVATLSRSNSEEVLQKTHKHRHLSQSSIPELSGRLVQSCAIEVDRSLRNLIMYVSDNFLRNTEGKQDLQVLLLMLVVLIACLILMNGNGKIEHHHHWEYFNPPKEL